MPPESITTYLHGQQYQGTLTITGTAPLNYCVEYDNREKCDESGYSDLPTLRAHARRALRELVYQSLRPRIPPFNY